MTFMKGDTNMESKNKEFTESYLPYVIKWGKRTNWLGILLSFGPVLVLLLVFDLMPPTAAIIAGFIGIASALGVNWFVEPISYFPIVGVAGTYMAFLTGNISNLRIPCSAVAQKIAGVEAGTHEGTVISTLGMSVSVLVNVTILTIGVFAGNFILGVLPDAIKANLNYMLPALFGAIFIQFSLMKPKLAPFALGIGLVFTYLVNIGVFSFLPGKPTYIATLAAVFGTIAIGINLNKRNKL